MLDHVTIRVGDLAGGAAFYGRVFDLLGFSGAPYVDASFYEWHDFSLAQAGPDRPLTRRLHVAFAAPSREAVDGWWRGMTAAGAPDAGTPGPRPQYGSEYYGAFVLDPDGNSVEAVHNGPPPTDGRVLDHLWLRVRSLEEAARFYGTVAPVVGAEVRPLPERAMIRAAAGATFSLLAGEPTEHVHLAFAAPDRVTVDLFHAAGTAAGFRSNGEPGERPEYHRGYYGAFLLDPDGNNVEAVFHERP